MYHIFIVVFLTESTSPYSLNTQRGWHTSECLKEISEKISIHNTWDYNLLLRKGHALYFQGSITLNANRPAHCQWGTYSHKNIWLQCAFCRPECILQIRLSPQQLKSQHVYVQHINKRNSHFNNNLYKNINFGCPFMCSFKAFRPIHDISITHHNYVCFHVDGHRTIRILLIIKTKGCL